MVNNAFPAGKYLSPVKVGPKGQIVIPAEVREMFGIRPGDSLLLLADIRQGIAIPAPAQSQEILNGITEQLHFGGTEHGRNSD